MTTNYINVTPLWAGIMPALIAVLVDGNPEGQRMAREELMKLARQLDQFNAGKLQEQEQEIEDQLNNFNYVGSRHHY